MQWKQIKTLFILCFLILNAYLLFIFLDKQDDASFTTISETNESTIEENLKSEEITISADLPEKVSDESYISVDQKKFTSKEKSSLKDLENQKSVIVGEKLIVSKFDKPVALPDKAAESLIPEIVKSQIPFPENYTFGSWNKDLNVLIFFQTKKGRPIYYNQNGILLAFLNDQNELIFYTQTMLGKTKSPGEQKKLANPMEAIQELFNGNRLRPGDTITDVKMGFTTRIPLESGVQVFAPTWTITINEKEKFYINAIENLIFSSNEQTFLIKAITSNIESMETLENNKDLKEFILDHLNQKLSSINRSEINDTTF